ncbi:MAG TPA: phage tail protein, partial [Pyrinomonadaceae bacterium]|nr:phage tail protein [Pyrinomonadaceae bacterium]
MASAGLRPYSQFNFLVDLGAAGGPHGGFQELRRINKPNKSNDITMKRGRISSATLADWLNQTRKAPRRAQRTVKVTQHDEQHRAVRTWTLSGAVIIKPAGPTLNAK